MVITQTIRVLATPEERRTKKDREPYLSCKVSGLGFAQCYIPDLFDQLRESFKLNLELECVIDVSDKVGERGLPYYKILEITSSAPPNDAPTADEVPADAGGNGGSRADEDDLPADDGGDDMAGNFKGMATDEEDQ